MARPRVVASWLNFTHLTLGVAGAALDILGRQGVGMYVAGFAGKEEINPHVSVKLNT